LAYQRNRARKGDIVGVDSGGFLDYKTGEILGCPGFTHFPQGG